MRASLMSNNALSCAGEGGGLGGTVNLSRDESVQGREILCCLVLNVSVE